jgi:hypothetical protein
MSNQRINIDSNIWGPKAWFFIDLIILSYPDRPNYEEIKNYKEFILSLRNMLPCVKCRKHYSDFIDNNPIDETVLQSKPNLVKWMLKCHNNVRKMQNKPKITLDDFYNYYINAAKLRINKETSEVQSDVVENFYIPSYQSLVALICIFIVMILLIYIKYNKETR